MQIRQAARHKTAAGKGEGMRETIKLENNTVPSWKLNASMIK